MGPNYSSGYDEQSEFAWTAHFWDGQNHESIGAICAV